MKAKASDKSLKITWSIAPSPLNGSVKIDPDSGTVTIGKDAAAGVYKVKAVIEGGVSDSWCELIVK